MAVSDFRIPCVIQRLSTIEEEVVKARSTGRLAPDGGEIQIQCAVMLYCASIIADSIDRIDCQK